MRDGDYIRKDVTDKAYGRAVYTDDLYFPGMLYARTVHTTVPRCRILGIDAGEALRIPGVIGVYDASDIPGANRLPFDKPMLVDGISNAPGDGICVVAATCDRAAVMGARAVKVEKEILPAILDPEIALSEKAPFIIHEADGASGNLTFSHTVEKGKIEEGFAEAEVIVEHSFRTHRMQHMAMEPDTAVVVPENGGLTVYCPCKSPNNIKMRVAAAFNLPQNAVRVIQPAMGGTFGGKNIDEMILAVRAGIVALKTGRPCRMTMSREEVMCEGSKRHPFSIRVRLGARRDGTFTAVSMEATADAGAYKTSTPGIIWRGAMEAAGPYVIPNVHIELKSAYTNHVISDGIRGFGSPQVDFAMECAVDMMAEKLGMSELELRRKNLLYEGAENSTGMKMEGVTIPECLDILEREFPDRGVWIDEKGRRCSRGYAILHRGESYGASMPLDTGSADIRAFTDGTVNLYTGIGEVGQGGHSAIAKICADELGIPYESIHVCRVDTEYTADSGATAGSRGTITGGSAVTLAAADLKRKITEKLGLDEDSEFRDGKIYGPDGSETISFADALKKCMMLGMRLEGTGRYIAKKTSWDFEKHQGRGFNTWSYGAMGAEVAVDEQEGTMEVTDLFCLHDIGRIINFAEAEAQIGGGVIMGLGYTVGEETCEEDGRPVNLGLENYDMPTAFDIKGLRSLPLELKRADNPAGVHGVGEVSTSLVAPAIANAFAKALGERIFDLPMNRARVCEAVRKAGEKDLEKEAGR